MSTKRTSSPAGGVIALGDAIARVEAWAAQSAEEIGQSLMGIRAYTIDWEDLSDIYETTGVHGMRVYFGVNEGEVSLLVVGVNEAGEDMIDYSNRGYGYQKVFDFTRPCPSTCDPKSPLQAT